MLACARPGWRGRTFETADVPCPLDDRHLEPEADTEEGDPLLACPLNREHHALRAAHAEPTRNEDTAAGMLAH